MTLQVLTIHHLRNLQAFELELSEGMNILWGHNGSGKTSVLEAISLLSRGRSFRATSNRTFITYDQPLTTLFAKLANGTAIGLEKTRQGLSRVRINQEDQSSIAKVAELLPVQIMEAGSFELIDGPSVLRRQLMHWGLFHVEHAFYKGWKQYQRVLKQRNESLRRKASPREIDTWTHECQAYGEPLKHYYEQYLKAFDQVFQPLWQKMAPNLPLQFELNPGWDSSGSLLDALHAGVAADLEQGYTHVGPHRADIKMQNNQGLIRMSYSRGQKKLLLLALKLAQGQLLLKQADKTCLYLIDDLAAELDEPRRQLVADTLRETQAQVILTSVDLTPLSAFRDQSEKLFHVEHGMLVL